MAGGATGGYWAIGNCVMATPPITMMKRAITQAKIGRSMKNRAMGRAPYDFAAEAEAAAEAGALAAAGAGAVPGAGAGCQGTGFTGAPGRSFWKPSTITWSPAF